MGWFNKKLEEFNKYLNGKRVAIIGLGVSNIPLIGYLNKYKADVTVFDNKEIDEIEKVVMDEVVSHGMKFSLGKNYLSNLKGFDLIFRSPSCLPTTLELVEEIQRGAIVTTEIEMVIELCPGFIIGVTGSDGKTTTTTLIHKILKEKGYNCYLGGNIGTPLFTEIENMNPDDVVVLELSSFQLMNMKVSPKVSVITNITPNHLDKHSCMEEYIEAKKNIFKHQDKYGTLVLNYDNEITREFAKEAPGKVIFFSSKNKISDGYIIDEGKIKLSVAELRAHILDGKDLLLKGNHNLENVASAIAATRDFCKPEDVLKALKDFPGVEHRLELVMESENRVKWYNDSVSSSPTRTIAGLDAFPFKNMILIAGGYDKNLDYTPLAKPILDNCKTLILLGQTADKIEEAVNNELKHSIKKIDIYRCNTLEETVLVANKISEKGDIVLFSPASASFDMFKNFAERGKIFKELVKKIVK
ncbi:MAG: UDP-N-acetylmuramoyl-L-alanine--D-glutamate ligase [Clostridia bacterium]|nr:UDP-N-acetylmuramoyl-L-alanine--D-glutamate ligase [Clostridia bacterium]